MNDGPLSSVSWEGINLVWLIMGLVGACLGVSYMPPMSKKQLAGAMASGVVFAALAPQWAGHYYLKWMGEPIAHFMNNTVAFVFGIGGMFIVPCIIVFWTDFRDNPWGFIEWIRGRARAPSRKPLPDDEETRGEGRP